MKIDPTSGSPAGASPGVGSLDGAGDIFANSPIGETGGVSGAGKADGADFSQMLAEGVAQANALQNDATAKGDALAKGASDDLHGTMITVKEAEISMKLVGTVRNKLLDAFHELWRINL